MPDTANAFLRAFPVGSTLAVAEFEAWVATQDNRSLSAAMLVGDLRKRLGSLLRLLSYGGNVNPRRSGVKFRIVLADKRSGRLLVEEWAPTPSTHRPKRHRWEDNGSQITRCLDCGLRRTSAAPNTYDLGNGRTWIGSVPPCPPPPLPPRKKES